MMMPNVSGTGGSAGPATSGSNQSVGQITFGNVTAGSRGISPWLIAALAAAALLYFLYGRRK